MGDQIKKNEIGGACSTYGGEQRCIQDLVGKPEGKRPLGRTRRKWDDNIKMDLQEVGSEGTDGKDVHDVWPALVKAVMNLWVP